MRVAFAISKEKKQLAEHNDYHQCMHIFGVE